ncbi:hypothetical protein [Paenibacillus agricola]|uniref:GIY-YIG domain-containing protein n=1 Tax=Paenibacillus agricola TaxID=2716264 RepID=A0ABX0JDN5_9BACL|nr:hypothetical protein [Paenibacillus agricola]NHN34627.1 hypothetical protein [Paenibacillus agricola]
MLTEQFHEFLSKNRLLPFSLYWERIEVNHIDILENKLRVKMKQEITKTTGKTVKGLYVYYNASGGCLYVGEGMISNRIRDHYNESHNEKYKNKYKKWFDFFSTNLGLLTVYWMAYDDEIERKAIEAMLTKVLKPKYKYP